jgi:hypothetical protein
MVVVMGVEQDSMPALLIAAAAEGEQEATPAPEAQAAPTSDAAPVSQLLLVPGVVVAVVVVALVVRMVQAVGEELGSTVLVLTVLQVPSTAGVLEEEAQVHVVLLVLIQYHHLMLEEKAVM